MATCPKCKRENPSHFKFCLHCGADLPEDNTERPPEPALPADLNGVVLSRYRIGERLGQDDCSEYYQAVLVAINEPVVVRALTQAASADRAIVDRFIEDARRLSALQGGRIRITDFEDLAPFGQPKRVAMMFRIDEGVSLAEIIAFVS